VTTAQRLTRATERLEEAAELALSYSESRSDRYQHLAAVARELLSDLRRGHTPSADTVSALAHCVELLADSAPEDSSEQSRADGATLTLAGLAEGLEEGL
jgi:hypothetical protein